MTRFAPDDSHSAGDFEENLSRVDALRPQLEDLAREVYSKPFPESDLDANLYADGFFDDYDKDRPLFDKVASDPYAFSAAEFATERYRRLFKRLKARNFPDFLTPEDRAGFTAFCAKRFSHSENEDDGAANSGGATRLWRTENYFEEEFALTKSRPNLSAHQLKCLESLRSHADELLTQGVIH